MNIQNNRLTYMYIAIITQFLEKKTTLKIVHLTIQYIVI